jgi:hypothetical protein
MQSISQHVTQPLGYETTANATGFVTQATATILSSPKLSHRLCGAATLNIHEYWVIFHRK